MTTCLYYNEKGDSIENTGINSTIEKIDGEEYIKCIPDHSSSFTIGSYAKASISPSEDETKEKEKDPEDGDKTAIIVTVCVIGGIVHSVGGHLPHRYRKRKNNQF